MKTFMYCLFLLAIMVLGGLLVLFAAAPFAWAVNESAARIRPVLDAWFTYWMPGVN